MKILGIKIPRVIGVNDDLFETLDALPKLREKTIVAVASKVVSLCEGHIVPKASVTSRDDLIIAEAQRYIPRKKIPFGQGLITINKNTLTVSAGIDEFGANYVLWPKNPGHSAARIQKYLRKRHGLKNLGIIITDSHTAPLRRGTVGFALGYFGFQPLHRYKGEKDLFGRTMKMTQANIADSLAAAAVLVMGEGGERVPLAIMADVPAVKFANSVMRSAGRFKKFEVAVREDIFRPLLTGKAWRKGLKKR